MQQNVENATTQKENIDVVEWASVYAETLLAPLGARWLHVQGVVKRATCVSQAFDEKDRPYLIAAAYLHDIGYAPSLKRTGFHPLDGAYNMRTYGYERLASLIAYHSEAQFEAHLRGYTQQLDTFAREKSALADALTYCDMTTSPTGCHITFEERLADIFSRYGDGDIVAQAINQAVPSLTLDITRTRYILWEHGLVCDISKQDQQNIS